jgi:UTP--glucose-1-phosphate uridylyltransferase
VANGRHGRKVAGVIIPAAGLGTRRYPATKVLPKELLPIADRPAIQHVIEEGVVAGLGEIVVVLRTGDERVLDHFRPNAPLEQLLVSTASREAARRLRTVADSISLRRVVQPSPLGLGDAVARCRSQFDERPFAVMLPDEIFLDQRSPMPRLLDVHAACGESVIALAEVPSEDTHLYGCVEVAEQDGDRVRITRVVEKPRYAPSNLAIVGRYVLAPAMMTLLERGLAQRNEGEFTLSPALDELARSGALWGVITDAPRFDTGTTLGYVTANVAVMMHDEMYAEKLDAALRVIAET